MTSPLVPNPPAAVVDASWVIGICAKEANKYSAARAKLDEYAADGWELFAPGVLIGEVLFVLCKKLRDGDLDSNGYASSLSAFLALMGDVKSPPNGDASLILRAEQIRGTLSCRRANDAIYLALAEELKSTRKTEFVTFDAQMENQAKASSLDSLLALLPVT